ncbi:MAG: SH3 domain-containing protein [Caldilineaceae bacterium]|nr:SH3 domain-containing protein [Caldilineaceae bacterium]
MRQNRGIIHAYRFTHTASLLIAVAVLGLFTMLCVSPKTVMAQETPPIFTDEIIPVPQPSSDPGFGLVGRRGGYLSIEETSGKLVSDDAASFRRLTGFSVGTTAEFYYQFQPTEYSHVKYPDGIYSGEQVEQLSRAVDSMLWVFDNRMDELMGCGVQNSANEIPGAYITANKLLDGNKLAGHIDALFFSSKVSIIAIGGFNKSQNSNGSYTRGVTFSGLLYPPSEPPHYLDEIPYLSGTLTGFNLNTNSVVWKYMAEDIMAGVIFHEILHNFDFGHNSNDLSSYKDRSKAILALQDCMAEEVSNRYRTQQPDPPANQPQSTALDTLKRNLLNAPIQTQYSSQASAFAITLFGHIDQFQRPDLGVSSQGMALLLTNAESANRINAVVNRIWKDWIPFNDLSGDPGVHPTNTPLRVLVIRMIQGRQLQLTDSEVHALYNLISRSESADAWRNDIRGIIAQINAESFQGSISGGTGTIVGGGGVSATQPNQPAVPVTPPVQQPTPQPQTPSVPASRQIGRVIPITNFETFGTWSRGDEPWGTFTQSAEQATDGRFSGKFTYDFPAVNNNYIVFRHSINIGDRPDALRLQVYGDGSTHFLNAWVQDANNQIWQFTFGRINHAGWQTMLAPLDLSLGWPNQPVGNSSATAPAYPIRLYALVLDGYTSEQTFQGVVYVDDLEAVIFTDSPNFLGSPASAPPAGGGSGGVTSPTGNLPTAMVISAGLNVRSGPGADYNVVGTLMGGQQLTVLEEHAASGWVRIASGPTTGWVSGSHIRIQY